jgi:hypothetical protein
MNANARTWLRWLLVWTVAFASINYLPLLGRGAPIWDAKDSFFPFFVLVADHIRAGRLVSWDVWSNSGLPRVGDPEFGAFSPVQLIVGLVFGGTTTGFIAYWMLIWWLGGVGLFMLARHMNAPPLGAFVVASGFCFSGAYTGHAEHISWLIGLSSLPFIIWRLDAALIQTRWRPAAQSGALWGMAATAAYPGLTVVTAMFMGCWTLGRVVSSSTAAGRGPGAWLPSARFAALALFLACAVGALVLSPVYFSFFQEGAGVHVRTGPLARDVAVFNNALDPRALVTIVSPYFSVLKFYRVPTLWPYTDVSSCSVYTGALLVPLAFGALLARPRDGWRWYVTAMACVAVAVALGQALPLRGWLYDWAYPTRFFRHATMFRLYFMFSLAYLALLGVRDLPASLRDSPASRRIMGLVSTALALGAIVAFYAVNTGGANSVAEAILGQVHLLMVWGGVAVLSIVCWMSPVRMAVRVPLLLVVLATVDAAVTAKLTRITTFSVQPADLAWWGQQERVHSSAVDLTTRGLNRTRAACESDPPCSEPNTWGMVTKVPALDTYAGATNLFFETIKRHPILSRAAIGPERIWFAANAAVAPPTQATFRAFLERTAAIGAPPMMIHPRQSMITSGRDGPYSDQSPLTSLQAATLIPVRVNRYTSDELWFSVESPSAGWLLVTERWARSWRAVIDGSPTPVFGGNFIFRAIRVPAGQHHVGFVYRPIALPWLLVVGWGTLVAVLIASLSQRTRPKQS